MLLALSLAGWVGDAHAQSWRGEISGNAGWVMSDGVTFDGVLVNGNIFDAVDPKDSFGFNVTLGFFLNDNLELEALYGRQSSALEVSGTATAEVGDVGIDNYHGSLVYNFGDPDARVRFYLSGGAGATHYGGFTTPGGIEIDGNTKFSSTWGAGVKIYGGGSAGLKLGARWTPTYIKSDAAGWWCDPFWGCFLLADDQYSNQFEFTGGITFRF